jgi:ArsR family transcriptional regulator, lead/cadmium/zinc/bismuth-responsive transcriptional repressor
MSTCSYIHMSDPTIITEIKRATAVAKATAAQPAECDAPTHLDERGASVRRATLMSDRTVYAVADTFRVLGDPTRVRILDALAGGELCVCDIAELAGISESAVSHQLRLLRGMRLVRPRRAGRLVYYSVDDQHIIDLLNQALTHVEEQP